MGGLVIVGGLVAAGCGEAGEWPATRVASDLGPRGRDRVGAVASRVASIEWLRASSILRGEWLARRGASAEWQIASVASRVASTGWRGASSEWLSCFVAFRGGAAAADERTVFAGTETMVVVVRVANRTKYQLCYIECGHAPAGRQAVPVLRPSPRAPGGHGRPPPPPPRPRRRDFVSYRNAVSSSSWQFWQP